ncbi:28743_t:CDS:2, partial [Gigaspora margarita]
MVKIKLLNSLECDNLEYNEKDEILQLASLEVEMLFDGFNYAKQFFNHYAKDNGFVVTKKQCKKDNNNKSIIVRRTFICHYGRSKKSKKVVDIVQQRDCALEKINCPWVCNINKIKDQESMFFSEVLEDIRFFTIDGQ